MDNNQANPRCPYFGSCGGCQLQHLPYAKQLELKTEIVRAELAKQGLPEKMLEKTLGMEEPWFYRNKIQFPIRSQNNRLQIGYFKARTHEVVNIKECYIQDPYLTEIAQIAGEVFEKRNITAYEEQSGKGLLRHFIGRSGYQTGEILLGIVVNGKGLPAAFSVAEEIKKRERLMHRQVARHRDYPRWEKKRRIVGIVQNTNTARSNVILGKFNTTLFGTPYLREKLGRFKFEVQLNSFFQVNPIQTIKLYNLVKEFAELSGQELVVDAYAGIGTISFWLADQAEKVFGVEESVAAVKDARKNINLNKMVNVQIEPGLIEKICPRKANTVVLDPPRGGCSEKALQNICQTGAQRLVYVSCNPETLSRDLKWLATAGFQTEVVQPVDMFPQTNHIEMVAKLSRRG